MNNLVNTLKAWREKELLSQEKAAKILGVSRPYLNQIENGRTPGAEFVNTFWRLMREPTKSDGEAGRINEEGENYGPRSLLKRRRKELGLSLRDLAAKIGCPASDIRNIEEGNTRGASEGLLAKLAGALDLPLESLMGGSDSPKSVGYAQTSGAKPDVGTAPGISVRSIPLISWAQAGELQAWEDVYEHEGVLAYDSKDLKAVAVKIRGDSMAPEYKEGTIAVIYPSYPAKNGDLVIARLSDGSVLFKRVQINGDQYTFISLNPVYPPITVDRSKIERLARVGATQRSEL